MVAYSFKRRFVAPILAGTKCGTIRAPRRGRAQHAKPGDFLQLYTAMRTKQCALILKTVCLLTEWVALDFVGPTVTIEGRKIKPRSFDTFAREDGFADFAELVIFWRDTHGGRSFEGTRILWLCPRDTVTMGASMTGE